MTAFDHVARASRPIRTIPTFGRDDCRPHAQPRRGIWRPSGSGSAKPAKYPRPQCPSNHAISVQITGDQATILACDVDDGILYEPASGKVLNSDVTTARDQATLTLVDGSWKLATRTQLQKWNGVAGCAVSSS